MYTGGVGGRGSVVLLLPSHVEEVNVTFFGVLVPSEHAVDSFREFSGRSFIDTTGIHPDPDIFVSEGLLARCHNLGVAQCVALLAIEEVPVG